MRYESSKGGGLVSLAEYKAPDNYPVDECPMCRAGEPITSF